MSLIRPEAAAALRHWREALIGAAVLALGLFWALAGLGVLRWIGLLLALVGTALIFVGVQRARFRPEGRGPGIVQVVEGRITYFGPLSGGVADIESLEALSLDPTAEPPHWILQQPGQPVLHIPVNAEGADWLFDVFAALPGIRTEHMLRHLQGGAAAPVVIWRAKALHARTKRLH